MQYDNKLTGDCLQLTSNKTIQYDKTTFEYGKKSAFSRFSSAFVNFDTA